MERGREESKFNIKSNAHFSSSYTHAHAPYCRASLIMWHLFFTRFFVSLERRLKTFWKSQKLDARERTHQTSHARARLKRVRGTERARQRERKRLPKQAPRGDSAQSATMPSRRQADAVLPVSPVAHVNDDTNNSSLRVENPYAVQREPNTGREITFRIWCHQCQRFTCASTLDGYLPPLCPACAESNFFRAGTVSRHYS